MQPRIVHYFVGVVALVLASVAWSSPPLPETISRRLQNAPVNAPQMPSDVHIRDAAPDSVGVGEGGGPTGPTPTQTTPKSPAGSKPGATAGTTTKGNQPTPKTPSTGNSNVTPPSTQEGADIEPNTTATEEAEVPNSNASVKPPTGGNEGVEPQETDVGGGSAVEDGNSPNTTGPDVTAGKTPVTSAGAGTTSKTPPAGPPGKKWVKTKTDVVLVLEDTPMSIVQTTMAPSTSDTNSTTTIKPGKIFFPQTIVPAAVPEETTVAPEPEAGASEAPPAATTAAPPPPPSPNPTPAPAPAPETPAPAPETPAPAPTTKEPVEPPIRGGRQIMMRRHLRR